MVVFQHPIDDLPRGFHGVFAREEGAVAFHCIAEEAAHRSFLARLLFGQVKLALLADKFLAGKLDACSQSDGASSVRAGSADNWPAIGLHRSAKSFCGGRLSSTRISVAVVGRYFPERKYHGTPSQRHESMKSRTAQIGFNVGVLRYVRLLPVTGILAPHQIVGL